MFAIFGYLLLYIQFARKIKQAHLQLLRATRTLTIAYDTGRMQAQGQSV